MNNWPYYRISSCWLLFVTLFCWSSWVCRWYCSSSASALRMMCCQFANDYNLLFNPGRTQLVQFSFPCSSSSPSPSLTSLFAGQSLKLADRACHLGHILRLDLSDTDDLICAAELTAFYLLFMPLILLSTPSYFVLSVFLSMALHCGDCHLTFNNLLRKIWKLPQHYHTSILHRISSLQSLFNDL